VLAAIRDAVRTGSLSSCHDVAEGGFLVALAECCLLGGIGATKPGASEFPEELLFGEDACGFIVSGPRDALERLGETIPLDVFGEVGGDALVFGDVSWTLHELRSAWGALAPLFP
jgi:phosphoribosylformylglycinamidine synthase